MSELSRTQRELELISLIIEDRVRFRAIYRSVMGIAEGTPLGHLLERDMLQTILKQEYGQTQIPRSDSEPPT